MMDIEQQNKKRKRRSKITVEDATELQKQDVVVKKEETPFESPPQEKIQGKAQKIVTLQMISLDPKRDLEVQPVSAHAVKTAKITLAPRFEQDTVLIQLDGGGRLAPFSYSVADSAQYGNTINLPIGNENEAVKVRELGDFLLKSFVDNQSDWFEDTRLTAEMLTFNHRRLFIEGKAKKDENGKENGKWPGSIRASADEAFFTSQKGQAPLTRILSHSGEVIDPLMLNEPGAEWDSAVIELRLLYTSGKSATGISKRFRSIKLKPMALNTNNLEIEFLPKPAGL